jgi:hypothetical protein
MADDDTSDDDFDGDTPDEGDFDGEPDELEAELDEGLGNEDAEVDYVEEAYTDVSEDEVLAPPPKAKPAATKTQKSADEEEEEEDDEVDLDDVEADLDAILKDRIAAQPEDEDEDELPEVDDRGDGPGRIQPKKADEFVCQSCFLVKHRRQLADEDQMLCVDCV